MLLSFSTSGIFNWRLANPMSTIEISSLPRSKGSGVHAWYWKGQQAEIEGQGEEAILLERR
jgi:hypothetical protein